MSTTSPHDDCNACAEYRGLSRRGFIAQTTATAIALSVPAWVPRVAWAQSASDRDILVSIFLRGGVDGLTLVAPFLDPCTTSRARPSRFRRRVRPRNRRQSRWHLLYGPGDGWALPLSSQASSFIHATGSNDPSRSHFDAQQFMEVGLPGDKTIVTGWLGRHRDPGQDGADRSAAGARLSYGLPVTLNGAPDTLPIPNPANFGLSGSSSTRTERLNWLANAYTLEQDPIGPPRSTPNA
jgi:uncharacterized protein (DUF1501 family)